MTSDREIGSMQIENERVVFVETNPATMGEAREQFFQSIGLGTTGLLSQIVTEWWAKIGEESIGYACLTEYANEEVKLLALVIPKYRGTGVGKLMIRLATDQAIRYRKRAIRVNRGDTNEVGLRILEDDEYERPVNEDVLRKELKWQ